jgi:hypothetical protein
MVLRFVLDCLDGLVARKCDLGTDTDLLKLILKYYIAFTYTQYVNLNLESPLTSENVTF